MTTNELARFTVNTTARRWFGICFGVLVVLAICSVNLRAQYGGGVTKYTIKSEVLGEERTILVRTPQNYETNGAKYPVLYLTDGDAHIGHTASTIEFLARNGRMSELIVVGITNTDRTRDLTPTHVTTTAPTTGTVQFPTSGGADKFLKFIETELIPDIEKRYRVQPYRVLAGHSFGGLFAVHTFLSRPELFNSYIAVSPSLQWDNEFEVKRAEEFFKNRKELKATLYLSLGNEPGAIGEGFKDFKALLSKVQVKGFEWQAEQMTDEDHGSVVMRSHYDGLRKIYDGWQVARDAQTGAFTGDLKAADEHYKWLSEKFGYQFWTPENLINQIGYQFLQNGKSDEAITVFKANVERYPGSANVYDSLAEAYERSGKIELATPLYEKAQTLGRQNDDPNLAIYKTNFERATEKMKQAEAARKNQP